MTMVLHAVATAVRSSIPRVRWWGRKTRATDYKGWRITPTSSFSPGKGWSPDLRIAALDAPDIEQHFPPAKPKFFATKAEADGYATNMGIALIDTALGGWRIPGSATSPRTD